MMCAVIIAFVMCAGLDATSFAVGVDSGEENINALTISENNETADADEVTVVI